jgi:hypothetical protein
MILIHKKDGTITIVGISKGVILGDSLTKYIKLVSNYMNGLYAIENYRIDIVIDSKHLVDIIDAYEWDVLHIDKTKVLVNGS